jgi:hypothetical protein
MDDLEFDSHARDEMARDTITEDEVFHVIGDADVEIRQQNGHTRYERMMDDGRQIVVILDEAVRTVKTAWWNKRGSRRRRRP